MEHSDKDSLLELGLSKQRSADLNFFLYRRALHPELFNIHLDKHLEYSNFQADIWVTGLSHLVTLQSNGTMVTELTAAPSELLTDRNLVTQFRFRGERDYSQAFSGGMRYILSTQVERMSSNVFPSTHRDLLRYAERRGMYTIFEEWGHEGLAPLTFIDFEAREREFHIHAFHVFPAERTILKTQSIFEKEPERRRDNRA